MSYGMTNKFAPYNKCISVFIIITFVVSMITFPIPSYAESDSQTILNLPNPDKIVARSQGYQPVSLQGMITHPDNPLEFDFIIDRGEETGLKGEAFNEESRKLIKYFLAALTTPEDEMWVNLSPYEDNRIIPSGLGLTVLGRDLLAQDYILKQITASLMNPEDKLGSTFWDRVYKKSQAMFGTTQIPMNTFNKIWIVPDRAVVYQKGSSAFVIENKLKVMLEEDYVALSANIGNRLYGFDQVDNKKAEVISGVASEIVKEILIPEIEYEVNNGKNFAKLRQIANAMVLASWYKDNLKESLLGYVYVDQNKTRGIDVTDKDVKNKIYDQYVKAFEEGVYNYIKEEYDPAMQQVIPRKYFTGGFDALGMRDRRQDLDGDSGTLTGQQQAQAQNFVTQTEEQSSMVNVVLFDAGSQANSETMASLDRVVGGNVINITKQGNTWSLVPKQLSADAARLSGLNIIVPANYSQTLQQKVGLVAESMEVVPLKGVSQREELNQIFTNPMARFVSDVSSTAALGTYSLRGQGPYTASGLDVKSAINGNAVQIVTGEIRNFTQNNSNIALVEMGTDGAAISPIGRIYSSRLGAQGYIDTVQLSNDGQQIESFDLDTYKRTIDTLRSQGVQVYYKVANTLQKSDGITDPTSLTQSTDSWAVSAVIGDLPAGQYMLPQDNSFRRAGISYNAPKSADVGPIDLPSIALPKIAQAHGLEKGTAEYTNFMNETSIVTMGSEDVSLTAGPGNERHAAIIADAVAFKQANGYLGMQVTTVEENDLMPRLMALSGPSELNNYRRVVSFGGARSVDMETARVFAQEMPDARMVSRLVSTESTSTNLSYDTADNFSAAEIQLAEKLGYTRADLTRVINDDSLGGKSFVAVTALTGSSDSLGATFKENMVAVEISDVTNRARTNTLVTDQVGNLVMVKTTYQSADMNQSKSRMARVTPLAAQIVQSPTSVQPRADLARLSDFGKASQILSVTPSNFARVMASRMDSRKVLDDLAKAGGVSAEQTLNNLVQSGMAARVGNNIYDYRFTSDFYSEPKLNSFRDYQAASTSNPAATDLNVAHLKRIIYNGVDQDGLLSDIASGQESQVIGQLSQARALPLLTSAWKLSQAKKQEQVRPSARQQVSVADLVNVEGIREFSSASGINVEFSAPANLNVSSQVLQALGEYQRAYTEDMALGQFNYRGAGTQQTVSDYFNNDFQPNHYNQIRDFVARQFAGGEQLKTIITNGTGANDQFMWALVEMYNLNRSESDPVWYHVTTASELAKIDRDPATTLEIDIDRLGSSWEGVQVANQTLSEGITKRIVLTNGGALQSIAENVNQREPGSAIQIGLQSDIGGRHIHRKTPVYYTAQTVAGMFVPEMDSVNFAQYHDQFDRMNDFANEQSLAVNSAKFLHAMMELDQVEHIAFLSNSRQTAILGTELGQYFMEGANRDQVISFGEHDLSSTELEPEFILNNLAQSRAGEKTFAVAVLDRSSPNYSEENSRVDRLKQTMPIIKFEVDSAQGESQGIGQIQQAAFDILTTDFMTSLTSFMRVDANANPKGDLTTGYVSQWRDISNRYQNDAISSGQTDLLLSFGQPGSTQQSSIGVPQKQIAVNTVAEAQEQGRQLARQMAADNLLSDRDRLNVFVGANELQDLSKEIRRDVYQSPLATEHGFITETGVYPQRVYNGHDATVAYRSPAEVAQGKAPLLANKSINVFLNQRLVGDDTYYSQPFQNVTGIQGYDNVNGASIHQINDALTFPNIQRSAQVAPTILFEFENMTPDIEQKVKAFNQAFTETLAAEKSAQNNQTVLSMANEVEFNAIVDSVNQQLAEQNIPTDNRRESIVQAFLAADQNRSVRAKDSTGVYSYQIDSDMFLNSLGSQLNVPAYQLAQVFSQSPNQNIQKLAVADKTVIRAAAEIPQESIVDRTTNNKFVLVEVEDGLEVRDTETGNRVSSIRGIRRYDSVAFTPDGARLRFQRANGTELVEVVNGLSLAIIEKTARLDDALQEMLARQQESVLYAPEFEEATDPSERMQKVRAFMQSRFASALDVVALTQSITLSPEELEAIAEEINELLKVQFQYDQGYLEIISEALKNSDDDARRLILNGVQPQQYNVNPAQFVTLLSSALKISKSSLVRLLTAPSNSLIVRQIGVAAGRQQLNVMAQSYNLAVRNASNVSVSELESLLPQPVFEKLNSSGVRVLEDVLLPSGELSTRYGITQADEVSQISNAVQRFGFKLPDAQGSSVFALSGDGILYLVDEINMTIMAMNQNKTSQFEQILQSFKVAAADTNADVLVIDRNYQLDAAKMIQSLSTQLGVSSERLVDALTIQSNSDFLKHIGHIADVNIDFDTEGIVLTQDEVRTSEAAEIRPSRVGGIDLNPQLLDLQIIRDDEGIPVPVHLQPIGNMNIDGFVPIIINVTPINNLPLLLGLADTNENLPGEISYNPSWVDRTARFEMEDVEQVKL